MQSSTITKAGQTFSLLSKTLPDNPDVARYSWELVIIHVSWAANALRDGYTLC